jgi:hypothetical protein
MFDYLNCFSSVDAGVGEDVAEAVEDADAASNKERPPLRIRPRTGAYPALPAPFSKCRLAEEACMKNSAHLC